MAVLKRMPDMRYAGLHVELDFLAQDDLELSYSGAIPGIDPVRLKAALSPLKGGQYFSAHLADTALVREAFDTYDVQHLFAVRDPRDIIVSYVTYVTSRKAHFHHRRYRSFGSFDEALSATIIGFNPDPVLGRGFLPLNERLRTYLGWLHDDRTLVVRYEDLVAPRDMASLRQSLGQIAVFCGRPVDGKGIWLLGQGIGDPWSATIHTGTTQTWKRHLNQEHLELLERTAAVEMAALGYPLG